MDKPKTSTRKILTIDEFVEQMEKDKSANSSDASHDNTGDEPTLKESKSEVPEPGDFVEDRYGNHYEVYKSTKDFNVADEADDWEQISKYKDSDVLFVIVWAKEDKEKKFVFVYDVDDEHAVRKVDIKSLDDDDELTKIFKKAVDTIENTSDLDKFKSKWRSFMDKVRAGKIQNEKHIMMEILDDFGIAGVVKEDDKEETVTESAKPALGDILGGEKYDVIYKGETYYIKPEPGESIAIAYTDESFDTVAKEDGQTLTFSIKQLFGVDKWQKHWVDNVGDDTEK